MKKVLAVIFGFIFMLTAHAGQIVNVDYVHRLIQDKWNIIVPVNNLLPNRDVAVNMEYLLAAIDVANKKLNGWPTSSYASTEYATTAAADTVAAQYAVEKPIKFIGFPFKLTTTYDTKEFQVTISAKGKFYINWGDGTEEVLDKQDTNETTYTHTYDTAGRYVFQLDGKATAYNNGSTTAAISFNNNSNVAGISGSLGQVFSTLANGTQPKFYYTFGNNVNLSGAIPPGLFSGITGQPIKNMFYGTFYGANKLSGQIPKGLFSGVVGVPTEGIYYRTFENCSG